MCLLVLKELVQAVGLENALGLVREEHGVAVEGDTQLSLRHFGHLLWGEHGGCSYTWTCDRESDMETRAATLPHLSAPTFRQSLLNLDWVGRQVQVCVVRLQVADRTVSSCHAEALDGQFCREDQAKYRSAVVLRFSF